MKKTIYEANGIKFIKNQKNQSLILQASLKKKYDKKTQRMLIVKIIEEHIKDMQNSPDAESLEIDINGIFRLTCAA